MHVKITNGKLIYKTIISVKITDYCAKYFKEFEIDQTIKLLCSFNEKKVEKCKTKDEEKF